MDTGGSTTGGNDATTTDMILATGSESCTAMSTTSSSHCNNATAKRRAMWRMQRRSRRKAKPASGSGRSQKQKPTSGRRRQRRLWQLPQSSIDEYTKWIQEKPEADRTPNEERFLWKSMIRSLGVVGGHTTANGSSAMGLEKTGSKRSRQERIREFVDRLEAKEPMELTDNEELFVRLYHKRRKDRKAQRQQQRHEDTTVVSWMRCSADEAKANGGSETNTPGHPRKAKSKKKKNKGVAGLEPQASLESLRESMNRMGLSSDKLKHVRFADAPMK